MKLKCEEEKESFLIIGFDSSKVKDKADVEHLTVARFRDHALVMGHRCGQRTKIHVKIAFPLLKTMKKNTPL